jgi:hypothetical protein
MNQNLTTDRCDTSPPVIQPIELPRAAANQVAGGYTPVGRTCERPFLYSAEAPQDGSNNNCSSSNPSAPCFDSQGECDPPALPEA